MPFEVCPLRIEWDEPLLLIVFTLQDKVESYLNAIDSIKHEKGELDNKDKRIIKLTDELNNTRAEMNSIIEAQEITYDELQAANEEIVSSNEEFQTLNEELETSKEEIEATNEELISTNQELQVRNDLLTESHEYSEAIYATIHEPILILDKNFNVKSANTSFYKKFQVENEEIEGKLLFDLGNKQWDIPSLREILKTILEQNSTFENFEVKSSFSGIGGKIMLLNARLINQKTSSEKLILLAIVDITEQSRFYIKENLIRKKAEDKFRGFLESAPDAIIIADTKGKIQLVNSLTETIFGYTRDEIIGQKIEMLIPSRFKDVHEAHRGDFLIQPVSRSMAHNTELFGLTKLGIEFPVEVSLSQLETDEGVLISAAIRDITEQKRISQELNEAKLNAEKATIIAEDAVKSKQQFLSNMSHEIRTPMNAIIGFTKVVLKTDLTSKQQEYLNAIKQSGNALIVLIDDILDLAKVNAGKMTFESKPFRLKSSISSMLHLFETKIQEKNLVLVKDYDSKIPDFIVGDSVRLHQMILNLISNAVKFTSVGKITLEVKLIDEDDVSVHIEFKVIDTGIGIPENKLTTIFENFQQAYSSTSRFYGGTGLGLAIVKQLVESQGGEINVESEVNKGSTFRFSLKFLKTTIEIDEEPESIILDSDVKNKKVLVVEDIALNQLLMKTILDDFGLESEIAENGKIAIDKIKLNEYDIILMDLQMPVMNGFETTEYIRKTLKLELPIIALTADVTTVDLEKCKAVGMNDYIAKPVDERLLYTKIVNQIKRSSPARYLENLKEVKQLKYVNLTYLKKRTKSDSKLMAEMISLYLEQTPPILETMIDSFNKKDWDLLKAAVHKLVPSFTIMGIDEKYQIIAAKIQENIGLNKYKSIGSQVKSIEEICVFSCNELKVELNKINVS